MGFNQIVIPVTTTGSAGSATGTAKAQFAGYIEAVRIRRSGGAANITVDIDEAAGLLRKLVDLAAGNTDVNIYPVVQNTDNTGAAVTGEYTRYFVPNTPITVSVAGANAAVNAVTVTIITVDH